MIPAGWNDLIRDLYNRIAELERRLQNSKRTGTISEVDAAKGLARVEFKRDEKGQPVLSPWIPWKEIAMGAIKTHFPPSVGEQVDVVSENGDWSDALIETSIPSNANPRPHNKVGEAMIKIGSTSLHMTGSGVTVKTGKYRVEAGKVEYQKSNGNSGEGAASKPGVPMSADVPMS